MCNFFQTERLPIYRGSLCECSHLLDKRKKQLACSNLNLPRVQFLHQVQDKEEVQDEEEEVPEDTPQITSSVTTSNVTNLEMREDLAPLPDLRSISPPQSLDEEEEKEEHESCLDDDSIKLTVSKEEAIKFVKNNFGVITRFLATEECKYLKRGKLC